MKKLLFLLILLLMLTGCTNINNLSYDEIINISLSEEVKPNTYVLGYKFYLPRSMSMSNDLNGNNILYGDGSNYYLYVDMVSYINKINNKYHVTENTTQYFKSINYNGKEGYILIRETLGGYLLEIMYNYAKIEVVTNDIKPALTNSLIILKSINYNEQVIKNLISDNGLNYDEETFNLLGPNNQKDSFLQYIEDYGTYEEEVQDEDILDIETTN